MEYLLHYVWQHRLYQPHDLRTHDGQMVEVIDPGIHNLNASGPDFINAKIRLGGQLWAGNVEVHLRSADWYRHRHDHDRAYDNVILHVVETIDREVMTSDGRSLPQLALAIPSHLEANYRELQAEETYPPCYRVIPSIDSLTVHAWLSRLSVERLEVKMQRIDNYLRLTGDDWERVFFIALARNFGFGTNASAFEQWAMTIDLTAVGKHRDDPLLVEAFFFGQAGLLSPDLVADDERDDHYRLLCREYDFLRSKFGLSPIDSRLWKTGRLRPQNFPHVRLSQLARLFGERRVNFSRLLEATDAKALRQLFKVGVGDYWRSHHRFGRSSAPHDKVLRDDSLNLLLVNTVSPLLFAFGRHRFDEEMSARAFELLETLPAERNYITRSWQRAGLAVQHAADSQAFIQLRQQYCDRKDCLRCRFGAEYLRRG